MQIAPPLTTGLFEEIADIGGDWWWKTEKEPTEALRKSYEFDRFIVLTRVYRFAAQALMSVCSLLTDVRPPTGMTSSTTALGPGQEPPPRSKQRPRRPGKQRPRPLHSRSSSRSRRMRRITRTPHGLSCSRQTSPRPLLLLTAQAS